MPPPPRGNEAGCSNSFLEHDIPEWSARKNAPAHVVLGVPVGASSAVVRKAYLRLALLWHPDKREGSLKAAAIFQQVLAAYEALTS